MKGKLAISILAAILTTGGLFYFGENRRNAPEKMAMPPTSESDSERAIDKHGEGVSIGSEGVFRNEEFGFSFNYPEGWGFVRQRSSEATPFVVSFSDDSNFIEVGGGTLAPGAYPERFFSLVLYRWDGTVQEYADQVPRDTVRDIEVDGYPAIVVETIENGAGNYVQEAYLKDGDFVYIFHTIVVSDSNIEPMKAIFEGVLSSFSFD